MAFLLRIFVNFCIPLSLIAACIIRYNVFSFIYLLYLFGAPFIQATEKSKTTLSFTVALTIVSAAFSLCQGLFHVVLAVLGESYGSAIGNCTLKEEIFRHVGLQSLHKVPFFHVIRLVLPDPVVFSTALVASILIILSRRRSHESTSESAQKEGTTMDANGEAIDVVVSVCDSVAVSDAADQPTSSDVCIRKKRVANFKDHNDMQRGQSIERLYRVLLLILLLFAGIVSPALLQAPYFVSFLVLMTWLSVSPGTMRRTQSIQMWLLLIYSAAHICLLYVYQFSAAQRLLDFREFKARLLGLTYIVQTSCHTFGVVQFPDSSRVKWTEYAAPIVLLLLYYTIALKISFWWYSTKMFLVADENDFAAEERLQQKLLVSGGDVLEEAGANTRNKHISLESIDQLDGCMAKTRLFVRRVLLMAKKKTESYRIMLLVMMVWSVVYVSWPSFAFLLAACFLWLAPLRYERTLRGICTPILLAYACALMCMTYVWGFRLHEANELPQLFNDIKAEELGFIHSKTPMFSIGVQVIFTLIFWLALYQNLHLVRHRHDTSCRADCLDEPRELQKIAATPLAPGEQATSFILSDLKALFSKYFIIVLVGMFFVIIWAPVVIFRIIYTIFFIYFLVTLQISLKFWRWQLRFFWWVVIIYSMLVQVLIYTYQFSVVPKFYERITGFNTTIMADIGLRIFDTKDLFVNMLTPTSFLVLLIIQVDFCHDEFMRITRDDQLDSSGGAQSPARFSRFDSSATAARTSKSRAWRQMATFYGQLVTSINAWYDPLTRTLWRLLELHWFKLVIALIIMICTNKNISESGSNHPDAINIIFIIIIVVLLPFRDLEKLACLLIMCCASVIVLAKMIYQLSILDTRYWISNCTHLSNNTHFDAVLRSLNHDNADYLGLYKVNDFNSHVRHLLILWAVLTVNCVIKYHQERACRAWNAVGKNKAWPMRGILFPGFTVTEWKKVLYPNSNNVDLPSRIKTGALLLQDNWSNVAAGGALVKNESIVDLNDEVKVRLIMQDSNPPLSRREHEHAGTSAAASAPSSSESTDSSSLPAAASLDTSSDTTTLLALLKFFGNYGFYKLGLELTTIFLLITASMRMDIFGYLHGMHAVIITMSPRHISRKFWLTYVVLTGVIVIYNFCCVVGLPPVACYDYAWSTYSKNLVQWLFLADYRNPPSVARFTWTLILFVVMCFQYEVFQIESNGEKCDVFGGEDNEPIIEDTFEDMHFGTYLRRNYLIDYIQRAVFVLAFWITMGVLFFNGIYITTLFCLGYILLSCAFTWMGNRLFLNIPRFDLHSNLTVETDEDATEESKKAWINEAVSSLITYINTNKLHTKKTILKWWKVLLIYNLMVIIIKLGSELLSCVFFTDFYHNLFGSLCIVLQLFGLQCQDPYNCYNKENLEYNRHCKNIPNGDITGDVICFAFLLFQKRIFSTRQFTQYKLDCLINNILSTFGARYISSMLKKEVSFQKSRENRRVERVTKKVNAIIARAQQSSAHEKPKDHYTMIRSGTKGTLFSGDPDLDLIWQEDDDTSEQMASCSIDKLQEQNLVDKVMSLVTDTGGVLAGRKSRRSSQYFDNEDESVMGSILQQQQQQQRLQNNLVYSASRNSFYDKGSLVGSDSVSQALGGETEDLFVSPNETPLPTRRSGLVEAPFPIPEENEGSGCEEVHEEFELRSRRTPLPKQLSSCSTNAAATTTTLAEVPKMSYLASLIVATAVSLEQANMHYLKLLRTMHPLRTQALVAVRRCHANLTSTNEEMPPQHVAAAATHDLQPDLPVVRQPSTFMRLVMALDTACCARSDFLAYFFMVLAHVSQANVLSLPYPLLVFLWGMLSVPRASRRFWLICLGYAQFCVVLKYLFQLRIIQDLIFEDPTPSSQLAGIENPLDIRRILGLQINDFYALYDVFVIFSIFFHRRNLKRYGQWRDVPIEEMKASKRKQLRVENNCNEAFTRAAEDVLIDEEEDDLVKVKRTADASSPTLVKCLPLQGELIALPTADIQFAATESNTIDPTTVIRNEDEVVSEEDGDANATSNRCFRPCITLRHFVDQLTDDKYKLRHDFYSYYFFFDFVGLLILVLGYQGFGPTSSAGEDVVSYISESRIPIPLTCMIIIQFLFILIDRGIFIRRSLMRKLYFQLFLILLFHSYLFFGLPYISKKSFVDNLPAQAFYFVKCIYFGLSAVQIRSGFPTVVLGNFLMKKIHPVNLILFIVYWNVPFLPEIRSCLDWMLMRSSLGLFTWLSVEDIRSQIFKLVCWQKWENDSPTPRARNRGRPAKYGAGLTCLVLIFVVIFSPILFFSFLTAVYEANPPESCSAVIQLGGYAPLVTLNAQGRNVQQLSRDKYEDMKRCTNLDSLGFLTMFQPEDITHILFDGNSTVTWDIAPPSLKSMLRDLNDPKSVTELSFHLSCRRSPKNEQVAAILSNVWTNNLAVNSSQRKNLTIQLSQNYSSSAKLADPAHLLRVFPRYIRLRARVMQTAVKFFSHQPQNQFSNISAQLRSDPKENSIWWQMREIVSKKFSIFCPFEDETADNTEDRYLHILAFSDRSAPTGFGLLQSFSIIGLYTGFVMIMNRLFRGLLFNQIQFIKYNEMPCSMRIWNLLLEIQLVQQAAQNKESQIDLGIPTKMSAASSCVELNASRQQDDDKWDCYLELEEELVAKLIYLYRDPVTMIKWTMPPKRKQQ